MGVLTNQITGGGVTRHIEEQIQREEANGRRALLEMKRINWKKRLVEE